VNIFECQRPDPWNFGNPKGLVQLGINTSLVLRFRAQLRALFQSAQCLADGVPKLPADLCRQALGLLAPTVALGKLNRLDLLAGLFDEIQIPRGVYDEVVTQGLSRGAPDAFTVQLFWQQQQWPIVDVPPRSFTELARIVGKCEPLTMRATPS
jgi:hypothetical protein